MTKLGVNIDHIATLREARKTNEPDPVAAAIVADWRRSRNNRPFEE